MHDAVIMTVNQSSKNTLRNLLDVLLCFKRILPVHEVVFKILGIARHFLHGKSQGVILGIGELVIKRHDVWMLELLKYQYLLSHILDLDLVAVASLDDFYDTFNPFTFFLHEAYEYECFRSVSNNVRNIVNLRERRRQSEA